MSLVYCVITKKDLLKFYFSDLISITSCINVKEIHFENFRYRREQTEGMEPDTLRHFKESFESYKTVKEKCIKNISAVVKLGKLTAIVKRSFFAAKSLEELDVTFTPFKTSAKTSLAERARTAGLGEHAENLLAGRISSIDANSLINSKIPGRETDADIEKGFQHVIADAIVYDKDFAKFLRDIQKKAALVMEVKESKTKENAKDTATKDNKKKTGSNESDSRKFEIYHDFSKPVKFIQSHQVVYLMIHRISITISSYSYAI